MSLFLFVGFGLSSFAQTAILEGTIFDDETGTTLPGATIAIVGTYNGTSSDMDGNYKLENIKPGDYSIKVSFIGYTDALFNGVSLKKNETKKLNVKLQLRSNTLQEVIVVGERVVDLESGKSEINIDRETIKEMAVRDVQDIVKMQAGVSENPDGIQIRGGRVYETQY
ncbi:MAG: carboxypeptidase-like regulatory domain-containing protein, partial [Salibacteraceae bacterium]|nr:carboxypeptidase-like regulatory domain-containing protein [Salibacteraceae bacterium]